MDNRGRNRRVFAGVQHYPHTKTAPISDPHAAGEVQVTSLTPELAPFTDVYFRGYDQVYPDLWRYQEWKREFDQFVAQGELPNLSLVRLGHDHMGSFGSALGGINTPETQQADNDVSVGLLVQAVANSPFAADTLIIVTEDDCQDLLRWPVRQERRCGQHALQPN
jgi:hypothetical protein